MRFIARRVVHSILILIAVSFLSFTLLQWAPGDYFDGLRMNPRISPETVNGLREKFGLDQPFLVRYERWMRSVAAGEMGFSFAYDSPVGPLLWARAGNTFLLGGCSTLLAWFLALPLGIWMAVRKGRWHDRLFSVVMSTLLAIPDLLLFLLLLLLALRTGWFPAGGMTSSGFDELNLWGKVLDLVRHLALPSLGLAAVAMPILVRHIRAAMVQALESPFLLAARGHGIPHQRLLWRYALPAASNPLISLFGLSIAGMLSASAIVEVVLSWPGLGPLMVQSVLARDVYVVLALILLSSIFLVSGNLLADLLLYASDPRIRVEQ
ncbi:MAG TPA: ABC transporter permease [Candidatus Acidoferrum sp.]|nr:ABC transporter permease [Candidatus Acidoferrum sp.]